jgi:hypothetical protein
LARGALLGCAGIHFFGESRVEDAKAARISCADGRLVGTGLSVRQRQRISEIHLTIMTF